MHGRGGFSRSGPPANDDAAREKATRSIFVANIAFETTEEQLRPILCEVGPVVSLKLIYDPVTGKSRGFGFCEYEDAETAMSAVRNLAGREVNGRPLRIDSAANAPGGGGGGFGGGGVGEVNRPGANRPQGNVEPPLHSAAVPPETAPEVITKAVASLPPEQMFELMKQMKWFIQHNPQEARQLLLHNPQLAYALLQAQVVMKIVDLETAQNLLHRAPRGPSLISTPPSQAEQPRPSHGGPPPPPRQGGYHGGSPRDFQGGPPPPPRGGGERGPPPPPHHGEFRGGPTPPLDGYGARMRGPPSGPGPFRGPPPRDGPPPHHGEPGPPMRGPPPPGRNPPRDTGDPQDQERAALIMQVLSLSDEQIRMLPPDQRNSILKLKEQFARSS